MFIMLCFYNRASLNGWSSALKSLTIFVQHLIADDLGHNFLDVSIKSDHGCNTTCLFVHDKACSGKIVDRQPRPYVRTLLARVSVEGWPCGTCRRPSCAPSGRCRASAAPRPSGASRARPTRRLTRPARRPPVPASPPSATCPLAPPRPRPPRCPGAPAPPSTCCRRPTRPHTLLLTCALSSWKLHFSTVLVTLADL